MKLERLEELLRTRPADERTYDRQLPDLAMNSGLVRSGGVKIRGGRPLGFAAAAMGVGLVIVVGAATLGPWRQGQTAASPSGSTPTAGRGTTRSYLTGSMKEARRSASATLLKDGRVLIVGGGNGGDPVNGGVLKSAELYDPATGSFTLTGSMNVARYDAAITTLADGRVLVVGGNDVYSNDVPSAELYDPATGQFTATAPPRESGIDISSTLLRDGRVLVLGWGAGSGPGDQVLADLYDPSTGQFTALGQLDAFVYLTAAQLNDGRVLVAGVAPMGSVPSVIFDPSTDKFAATGSMVGDPMPHTATLLPNGRVLLIEGEKQGGVELSSELYDPATGKFTTAGDVGITQPLPTTTQLANGKLLIAGNAEIGTSSPDASKVLLYDPSTGGFNPGGSTLVPRREHTATLLADGRVLLAGGVDGGVKESGGGLATADVATSSAEIYDPSAPVSSAPTSTPVSPVPTGAPVSPGATHTLDPQVVSSFGSDKLSAAVLGPDGAAYLIDSTVSTVYRVSLDTGARVPVLNLNLAAADGTPVGRPKLLAVGGADVLILDDSNTLWRWHPAPGDKTGRGALGKVNIPDSLNWGSDVRAIATREVVPNIDLYDLYVTIPSRHQVVRYQPAVDGSGYPTDGMSTYLAVDTDVSTVDDMYIDGHVYLVNRGKVVRYDQGDNISGWSPQSPHSGDSTYYMKLAALDSNQDAGLFYAYDQTGRRIVAFDKSDGKVAGEYVVAAGTGTLQSLTGMFVGRSGSDIDVYWTEGGNLMSASLSGAGPSASPSAGPTYIHYTVEAGDTIASIAQKFHVRPSDLIAANPQFVDLSNTMMPGFLINIPPPR
ncbi:MAG TPA: LysM peptidoglycan-binding domain-containing protein [Candidatus Limnocylindrales bacterium]